jgi:hypothetical protein
MVLLMPRLLSIFKPQESIMPVHAACEFHLKGCCFDPQKTVNGFLAAPCFGCKDAEESTKILK